MSNFPTNISLARTHNRFYLYAAHQRTLFGISFGQRAVEKSISAKLIQLQARSQISPSDPHADVNNSNAEQNASSINPGGLSINVGEEKDDLEPDLEGEITREREKHFPYPSSA